MRRHVRIPVSVVQTSKSHVKAASAKARSRSACAGLLSELFLGRDTKVIAIDCKNRGWTGFPRSTRSSTMVYPGSSIDVRHMPRIIAGAFAGTARSTCRVPRQNLGHRESAGWPVSVRALFLFYLKNYHLHRRKSFHDKDTIRSLRGARNPHAWRACLTPPTRSWSGQPVRLPQGRGGVRQATMPVRTGVWGQTLGHDQPPAGYRTFLLNFARPDGGLPRICARKISALRGTPAGLH